MDRETRRVEGRRVVKDKGEREVTSRGGSQSARGCWDESELAAASGSGCRCSERARPANETKEQKQRLPGLAELRRKKRRADAGLRATGTAKKIKDDQLADF